MASLDLTDRAALMRSLPRGGIVVEVGVELGIFSRVILAENQPSELYLIDAWREQPDTVWEPRNPAERRNYAQYYCHVKRLFADHPNVHVIRAFSLEGVRLFDDESLDIVYIDSDHLRAGEDIPAWWPKVKQGGWLTGHDYTMAKWITVRDRVDEFVRSNNLDLHVTRNRREDLNPSWAFQKPISYSPLGVFDTTALATGVPLVTWRGQTCVCRKENAQTTDG